MSNLSTTLHVVKNRLRQFTSEAEVMKAICNSKIQNQVDIHSATQKDNHRTLRPRLPVEIVDTVFSFAPRTILQSLLLTNTFISALALRYLYRDVVLTRPPSIIAFLRRVVANKNLALLVRSLDLNLTKTKQDDALTIARPMPTNNLYQLLHKALFSMQGLLSVALELPRSDDPLWIFSGCTFRLRQFTTSMLCRRPLAAFLETQDTIVDLTLRGYQSDSGSMLLLSFIDSPDAGSAVLAKDRFALASTALPNLRSFNAVHADADLVRAVVQGRPVEIVSVPLFPDRSVPTLDALLLSTVPLRRLSVISFDPAAPTFLFESVAKRFTELSALHLVMLMAEYTQELLEQSGPYLSNFNCLKYITFMAAPSTPPVTPPLAPTPTVPAVSAAGHFAPLQLPPLPLASAPAPVAGPTTGTGPANFQGAATHTLQTLQTAAQTIAGSTRNMKERDKDPANPLSTLDAGEADIARQWHRACPTLRTIILPQGRVWFQTHREREDTSGSGGGTTSSGCGGERCSCGHRKPRKTTAKFQGKGKARAGEEVADGEFVYWRESQSGSVSGSGSTPATAAAAGSDTNTTEAAVDEGGDSPVSGPSRGHGVDMDINTDDTVWVPL
ncbi:hypothetical protein D9619_008634 [Psilocybe cf. subviscida]|uniref:Uncharacterized protein n=1 Tax=Psilocybe cf. subviscida TaxID=2480587 RepID=A0A8H5B9V7_9AGAR|nr:hypothetical protein D9619_008634 [Psilocybe cf. subviscida]